jgi:hypothetical protein
MTLTRRLAAILAADAVGCPVWLGEAQVLLLR